MAVHASRPPHTPWACGPVGPRSIHLQHHCPYWLCMQPAHPTSHPHDGRGQSNISSVAHSGCACSTPTPNPMRVLAGAKHHQHHGPSWLCLQLAKLAKLARGDPPTSHALAGRDCVPSSVAHIGCAWSPPTPHPMCAWFGAVHHHCAARSGCACSPPPHNPCILCECWPG
jgi:hypothetical protein